MSLTVVVHVNNEDPILCEIERLPDAADQVVVVNNPRMRDGKELYYLDDDVTTMIIPWHRVNFVQVLPITAIEEVVTFVRE